MSRVTEALRRARETDPHLYAFNRAPMGVLPKRPAPLAAKSTPAMIREFVRDFQELVQLWNGAEADAIRGAATIDDDPQADSGPAAA